MVIAFAGCPNLTSGYVNVQSVLANGTAGQMDAVSEHTYGQLMLPEKNYPIAVSALRTVMTAGGCPTTMPIWDTEQGIHADGDGYKTTWMSEADVAQFYARGVLTAASQGSKRFFWFSADNAPDVRLQRHVRQLRSSSPIGGAGRLRLVHRGRNLPEDLQPR